MTKPTIAEQIAAVEALAKHSRSNEQSLAIEAAHQTLLYVQKYGDLFRTAVNVQRINPDDLGLVIECLREFQGSIKSVRDYRYPAGAQPEQQDSLDLLLGDGERDASGD